jgi:DNA-binding beta-propeller fold protein YncE
MAQAGSVIYLMDHSGFASPTDARILKFNMDTNQTSILSSGGNFVDPYGIVRDPISGDLFVADMDAAGGNGAIIRINAITGAQTILSSGNFFVDPVDLAFDLQGQLIVADIRGSNSSILVRVNPVTGAQTLLTPNGIGQNLWGISVVVPEPAMFGLCAVVAATLLLRCRQGGNDVALALSLPALWTSPSFVGALK